MITVPRNPISNAVRGELTAPHRLMSSGEIADVVEVADINWNRNIGGVTIIQEMLEADLDGNGADEFAEARHLEIFHIPDFEHEGAEVFANEGHLATA